VDSSDFGLALPFRGAFNYYFIAPATEMRAARIRFGHTRNRDCIFITGRRGGKQMDTAVAAERQLNETGCSSLSWGEADVRGPYPDAVAAHGPANGDRAVALYRSGPARYH
jgi:hypothetical protein